MLKNIVIIAFTLLAFGSNSYSQELVIYKQIDTTKLYMEVYKPAIMEKDSSYPAMVFFFGGGWNTGTRKHFLHHAKYFSQKGIVCFLVDYRIKKIHGTDPFICLSDAKSAIRYVRKHASVYQVDTSRIIGSGGSAGGHLAAATALSIGFDDPNDDLDISCKPNALVVYNGVLDNGPGGYAYDRIGEKYKEFSPLHNIRKGAPPTILFLGTKDHIIPVTMYGYYKLVMDKVKSTCVLKVYDDGKHGFFNYNKKDMTFYENTIYDTQVFLESLGYLKPQAIFKVE